MSTPPEAGAPLRHRAGRYIAQPTGYRAFSPAPLPPQPPVRLEGELQALLSKADRALGRLDGSIQTVPNPDLFVFMYVRKEAVLSSQIEGTQSSLQDLLAAEADLADWPRPVGPVDPERPVALADLAKVFNADVETARTGPAWGKIAAIVAAV